MNTAVSILILFTVSTSFAQAAQAEDTSASLDLSFSMEKVAGGTPSGWEPLTFKKIDRHTSYHVVKVDGMTALKAESDNSASGLVYSVDRLATLRPILTWKWKIKETLPKGDARYKNGDDFAARIYVVFKHPEKSEGFGNRIKLELEKIVMGRYSPGTALNYIWANRLPKGSAIPNAYSERSMMIAVESGNELQGRWVSERVNIVLDYRKYFKKEPPPLHGLAIMTDSDNTKGRAEAWYADLRLSDKDHN